MLGENKPGPDPIHAPVELRKRKRKRERFPRPSKLRVAIEVAVVLIALAVVVLLVPLSHRSFPYVTAGISVVVITYVVYGVLRRPGIARWWGLSWDGRHEDDLARGLYLTVMLFFAALLPIAAIKCFVRTPVVVHPVAYILWCFVQDFLFYSILQRGLERLGTPGVAAAGSLAILATATMFGLSHFPYFGFMLVTAFIGILWGWLFRLSRWIWPVTALHFVLGILLLS